MKRTVCTKCGGTEFQNSDSGFICAGCGSEFSAEEFENMTVELEEPVNEAPAKKPFFKRPLVISLASVVAVVLVATVLLLTVFAPFGTYLKARWHILWKNYPEAYSALRELDNDPVLDSGHLKNCIKVVPGKIVHTLSDGDKTITKLEYDENGNIIKEISEDHYGDNTYVNEYRYEYDKFGNKISEKYYNNGKKSDNETVIEYDDYGNLTYYDDGYDILEISYEYDNKLAVSGTYTLEYEDYEEAVSSGDIEIKRDKQGFITEFKFLGDFGADGATGTLEAVFTITYGKYHYVEKQTSEINVSYTYSDGEGEKSCSRYEIAYENGKVVSEYEYDSEEYIGNDPEYKDEGTYEDSRKIEYKYDNDGNLIEETHYRDDNLNYTSEYFDYDEYGNYERETYTSYSYYKDNPDVYVEECEYKYKYDEYGNILEKKIYRDGKLQTTYEYSDYQYYYNVPDVKNMNINVFETFYDLTDF